MAWSAALGKLNRTFLSAKGRIESRGGSSIFSIYRYKVASCPVELPAWEVVRERWGNVIKGKEEVLKQRRLLGSTQGWQGTFQAYSLDVAEIAVRFAHQADYIFTDPPYGGHIAYLDLSTLWNRWLGFEVAPPVREREIIVGGELGLTEEHYTERLRESIRLCVQMLKPNAWLSVVFQHWNVRYFEAILEAAAESGATLKAAVTQTGDTIWSMHKKKNKEKVLAGELILTFLNDGARQSAAQAVSLRIGAEEIVESALAGISPDGRRFAGESLFNRIVLLAWERGALRSLDLTGDDFSQLLVKKGWSYNMVRHQWVHGLERVSPGFQLTF